MTDYFLLDPTYKDFPEKKLRFSTVYSGKYRFLVSNLLVCLLFGFFLVYRLSAIPTELRFITDGTRKAGVVSETCSTNPQTYTYTYDVGRIEDGSIKTYFGKSGPAKFQTCPKVGDRVLVEFLRSEPETSRAVFASTSNNRRLFALGFSFLIILVIFLDYFTHLYAFIQAILRYKRLRQAAIEVEGKVLYITISHGKEIWGASIYSIQVDYEVEINNKRLRGSQLKNRPDLQGQYLPTPGTPVRVLYADENTYVML